MTTNQIMLVLIALLSVGVLCALVSCDKINKKVDANKNDIKFLNKETITLKQSNYGVREEVYGLDMRSDQIENRVWRLEQKKWDIRERGKWFVRHQKLAFRAFIRKEHFSRP